MQAWQAEVRDQWKEHRRAHERIEEKIDDNAGRIVSLETKFDNGVYKEIQTVARAHEETRKVMMRIIFWVLGGFAIIGSAITGAITLL